MMLVLMFCETCNAIFHHYIQQKTIIPSKTSPGFYDVRFGCLCTECWVKSHKTDEADEQQKPIFYLPIRQCSMQEWALLVSQVKDGDIKKPPH